MTREECNYNGEWDYLGYRLLLPKPPSAIRAQKDWVQTLITKINQISAQIHKRTLRGGGTHVTLNPKLRPILLDLEYFNQDSMSIAGRYEVVFDDSIDEDVIFVTRELEVYDDKESGEPRFYMVTDGVPSYVDGENEGEKELVNFTELTIKLVDAWDEENMEMIQNWILDHNGYIDIINFDENQQMNNI